MWCIPTLDLSLLQKVYIGLTKSSMFTGSEYPEAKLQGERPT